MTSIQRKIVYSSKISSKISEYILSKFQFFLLSFYKEKNIVDLIKQIKTDVDFAVFPYEAYLIYSIAKTQEEFEGEMAEIGVYQGGSAKLICEAKKKRNLFLFDTFEGLPDVSNIDTHFGKKFWDKNQFNNTSEEQVRTFLKDYDNVKIVKGIFPDSVEHIENTKFSFVHLDVDLYKSTIDCLRYFFPRMINGGIILIHDFHTDGIKKAIKEFSSENPIQVIDLNGTQGMILKH